MKLEDVFIKQFLRDLPSDFTVFVNIPKDSFLLIGQRSIIRFRTAILL